MKKIYSSPSIDILSFQTMDITLWGLENGSGKSDAGAGAPARAKAEVF